MGTVLANNRRSINHPIAVANYLASTGITDVRVLQAAVLHDTVEDTDTTVRGSSGLWLSISADTVQRS